MTAGNLDNEAAKADLLRRRIANLQEQKAILESMRDDEIKKIQSQGGSTDPSSTVVRESTSVPTPVPRSVTETTAKTSTLGNTVALTPSNAGDPAGVALTGTGDTASPANQAAQLKNNPNIQTVPPANRTDAGGGVTESTRSTSQVVPGNEVITRVTLRPKPGKESQIYGERAGGNIMTPLYDSNGVVFPYTPQITSNFSAEYGQYSPTHSISDFYAYKNTPAPTFNIFGQFSAQNKREAEYCLAVIHFFRTVTKMYFGQGPNVGLAPPILHLNGYGNLILNNLPVIITTYTIEFLNTVDYVRVQVGASPLIPANNGSAEAIPLADAERRFRQSAGEMTLNKSKFLPAPSPQQSIWAKRLLREAKTGYKVNNTSPTGNNPAPVNAMGTAFIPSLFTISITAVVQHTPKQTRDFNLDSFRKGELLTKSGWPVPNGGWW